MAGSKVAIPATVSALRITSLIPTRTISTQPVAPSLTMLRIAIATMIPAAKTSIRRPCVETSKSSRSA